MRHGSRLETLLHAGVIEEIERPLLSGKEAEVYLVNYQGYRCVAKLYKEANNRSFRQRAMYTEGRRGRNSRRERAMAKSSRYGREEAEAAWRSAEVDAIYRLRDAGVRVPEPYDFVDGVLIMEMVSDRNGEPAPRLCDVNLDRDEAMWVFDCLLREVVKMLCAGLVHGDLSDFNVLLAEDGPVIIDFPQAINAAANNSARRILIRDVNNLQQFLSRWVPGLRKKRYGEEIWGHYDRGTLTPDTELTGRFERSERRADTMSLLEEIEFQQAEARKRKGLPPLESLGKPMAERASLQVERPKRAKSGKGRNRRGGRGGDERQGRQAEPRSKTRESTNKRKRSRSRHKKPEPTHTSSQSTGARKDRPANSKPKGGRPLQQLGDLESLLSIGD